MSKYHAAATSSNVNLSAFSLRGFYLAITCDALGYKLDTTKKIKAKEPASADILPIADVPGTDLATASDPTLKMSAHAQNIQLGVNTNPQNQLHGACIDFNDLANWNKQVIISRVLTPVAVYCGRQSANLRKLDATIPWEPNLRQLCTNVRTYHGLMEGRPSGRAIARAIK